MKTKRLMFFFATFIGLTAFAQTGTTVMAGSTTFGVRAGVNFQNINGKDGNDNELENKLMTGFHAGVNAEIPVGTGSYLQPGILYSMKGADDWYSGGNKVKLSYVEVPINFIYKPVLGTGNMLLGFGPYIAFGIGGKVEAANGNDQEIEFVNKYDPNNFAPQLKRFDAGGNLLAGYELANGLSFQLNAQLGLVNINPEGLYSDITKMKNTGFGVSVGYRFNK